MQSLVQFAADWSSEKPRFDCLNGRFIVLIDDEVNSQWIVITDPFGSLHAYAVWNHGRVTAIGTDLAQIAHSASNRTLDWHAISTLFAFGFFLGDRTYYDDVRILLPGSLYRYSYHG